MSIGGSSSAVADFSAPNISSLEGVPIKRIPAGAALGSDDLAIWSSRRSAGWSGTPPTKQQFDELKRRKQQRKDMTYPNSGVLFRNHD